jgi:hypothetical protein
MKAIERRVRNSSQLNPQGGGEIITKAKRVAFYVRVSTSDQTCASQRQWVCWRDLAHFAKLRGRKCGASPDVPVGDSVVQIDRLKRVFTGNNKDAMYSGVDCFAEA